jgi:hypothetical protein
VSEEALAHWGADAPKEKEILIAIFCCYRLSVIACTAAKSVQAGGSYLCFYLFVCK